ncbi:MAG: hypothetical protein ACK51V_02025 [bacterium]|jgi:hypothetical protein|nr:hypothetical protein [Betaproteobacteria bacterium]
MKFANAEKVETYRKSAKKSAFKLSIAMLLSGMSYIGAFVSGNSPFGWSFLVVAVAASFFTVLCFIHSQEQDQSADLLEQLLELSDRANAPQKERGP